MPSNCLYMDWTVYSFVCPISFYLINETNSLLSLTISGSTYKYNIPYGNYNVSTFTTALLSILPAGFTLTLNSINNKFTLGYTLDFTINSNSTIYKIMGFKPNTAYTSSSHSLTFPYTCNFNGLQSFNIHLTNIITKNIDSLTKSPSNIIQSIPVDVSSSSISYIKNNMFKNHL